MEIAINEAKGKLSGLINAALEGEQIVLTKHGKPVAEIKPLAGVKSPKDKLATIRRIMQETSEIVTEGPDAVHSADFLYDDAGMPQ